MNRQFILWAVILLLTITGLSSAQEHAYEYQLAGRIGRGHIHKMQFSDDNQLLAVMTTRGIWIYQVNDLSIPPRLFAPEAMNTYQVNAMSVNSSLTRATGVNTDGIVHVWDIESSEVIFRFEEVLFNLSSLDDVHVMFDPTNTYIAAISMQQWIVWDAVDGHVIQDDFSDFEVAETYGTYIDQIAFNPQGTVIGVLPDTIHRHTPDRSYRFVDIVTGELVDEVYLDQTPFYDPLLLHASGNDGLVLMVNERQLYSSLVITIMKPDPAIDGWRLIEVPSRASSWNSAYQFSRDFALFAVADERDGLRIWDVALVEETSPCPDISNISDETMQSIDITTCDSSWLALVSEINTHETQSITDTNQTTYRVTYRHFISLDEYLDIREGTYASDPITLSSSEGIQITLNRPDTMRLGTLLDVSLLGTRIVAVWSGGSDRDFVGNSVIAIWQLDDGQNPIDPTYTAIVDNNSSTYDVTISSDGTQIVTVQSDNTIRGWSLESLTPIFVIDTPITMHAVTFGENTETIMVHSSPREDGIIYIYSRL